MTKDKPPNTEKPAKEGDLQVLARRHLRLGWWGLLIFLSLGIVLEALHTFKVGYYLNHSNETRRLLWRLAHAHGTLLALVQIGFGCTLLSLKSGRPNLQRFAAPCLLAANIGVPLGFFLGGTFIYDADPGLGIILVPFGALLLFAGVWAMARSLGK
jgi:hypothetical protein